MTNEVRTVVPDLKSFLAKHIDAVQSVATNVINPERMMRLVCATASRDSKLAECSAISILRSMTQAAELGLEVCSGANEGYLVPRWNKHNKCMEATFLPGYQGLIKLARESGDIRNVEARLVYAEDVFDYELGVAPTIKHKPTLKPDRGEIIAVYAVAHFTDGGCQFDVMTRAEVDAIMGRAKDGKDGFSPWKSDYGEMARKTAVRRLAKYLPKKSRALVTALEIQAKSEAGEVFDSEPIRPGQDIMPEEPKRVLNCDGDLDYNWTQDDRKESTRRLDDALTAMTTQGVPDAEAEVVCMEYQQKIGDRTLDPERWHNRLLSAVSRSIQKAKTGSAAD